MEELCCKHVTLVYPESELSVGCVCVSHDMITSTVLNLLPCKNKGKEFMCIPIEFHLVGLSSAFQLPWILTWTCESFVPRLKYDDCFVQRNHKI